MTRTTTHSLDVLSRQARCIYTLLRINFQFITATCALSQVRNFVFVYKHNCFVTIVITACV